MSLVSTTVCEVDGSQKIVRYFSPLIRPSNGDIDVPFDFDRMEQQARSYPQMRRELIELDVPEEVVDYLTTLDRVDPEGVPQDPEIPEELIPIMAGCPIDMSVLARYIVFDVEHDGVDYIGYQSLPLYKAIYDELPSLGLLSAVAAQGLKLTGEQVHQRVGLSTARRSRRSGVKLEKD